jgi:hypothetical protein
MKEIMATLLNRHEEKDMTHTLKTQARRTGVAAAVAFAVFGTGTAQAAVFASADISIAPRTNEAKEVAAGDLVCSFREKGLGPYAQVSYECKAAAVAVVEACVYKNKIISATETSVFTDVSNVEGGHEGEVFLAKNNGQINDSVVTAVPEGGEGGGGGGGETHLCPEIGEVNGPVPEQEVVAIRWCNASLTDTTNNLVGAEVGELFQEFIPGAGTVPSCAEIVPPSP